MKESLNLVLTADNAQNLELFKTILKKNTNQIFNEALSEYFNNQNKILLEKDLDNESAMTNLNFNEFWDDVDI